MTIINQSSIIKIPDIIVNSHIIVNNHIIVNSPSWCSSDAGWGRPDSGKGLRALFWGFVSLFWLLWMKIYDLHGRSFQGEEARLHCEVRGGGEIFSLLYNLRNHNLRATTALHHLGEGWSTCETSNSHKFSSGLDFVTCHSCHLRSMSLASMTSLSPIIFVKNRVKKCRTFCDLQCVMFLEQTLQ